MSFRKVLVANRGEIAVRVFRACRELGIETVAVYSEADTGAMHRRLADEAYPIGPAPPAESYLNIESILAVVERSGAQAVHPGYGFLSESAVFARAVERAGAVWIGPPPRAMEEMGLKVRAKELARRAKVPTIPGYKGTGGSEERLAEEAERIGYPVLVKASAGGGGRGMRAVAKPQDFLEALRGARREALSAFGDGSVFLEKFIEKPRHVEVQIIGDDHGNVLHLYERECSIQRRHQKVIEEAPSPALSRELREAMCDAAVRLASEAGYRNAGTVEFLLDGDRFYFLEMNARLQVEHPVTEFVTGLDLVHLQLSVASGDPLPLSQAEVALRGSSIEARIYTEGESGLPAGGRLLAFAPPEGPGIRNDSGVENGDEVPVNYDPLISKLIVFAPERETAVRRLRRSLREYTVLGVPTNLPLLRRIAEHPGFAEGEFATDFLEEHRLTAPPEQAPAPDEALLLAAVGDTVSARPASDPFDAGPWRMLGAVSLSFQTGGEKRRVEVERTGHRVFTLRTEGREAQAEILAVRSGELHIVLDGNPFSFTFAEDGENLAVALDGATHQLSRTPSPSVDATDPAAEGGAGGLVSPMPGTLVKLLVGEGDRVERGQPILVMEAMKMEHSFTAPCAGVVKSLPFGEGDLVPGGAVLVELGSSGAEAESAGPRDRPRP